MEFHCWGISHKSTSLEVREKFAFNKEKIDEIIANLKSLTPFDNGIFLSTCNRTEFYSFCKRTDIKVFDQYLENLTGKNINLRKNDQYLFSNNELPSPKMLPFPKYNLVITAGLESSSVRAMLNNKSAFG